MTKIQKAVTVAAAFVMMIGLSACQLDGTDVPENRVSEFVVTLEDGTKVPCVKHKDFYGIDCNWDKATRVPAVTP
jgi:hypothetical protein